MLNTLLDSPQDLQERRLFALLPLQVFRSRKNMRRIAASRRPDDEKRRLKYLYRSYGDDQQTEEVSRMIKTFIDPEVLKKGREQGQKEGMQQGMQQGKTTVARKLLKLGVDIGTIVEATGLTEEELLKLGKKK
ncbi:hypothetical protein ACF3MZ_02575 [Paenibacillaceae bacterium WGS1546]|uniref:hypothetical protein n=1 Tax=Cohnella sp. WGS1546 TaxID=3366810 RepID=UPI00372D5F05